MKAFSKTSLAAELNGSDTTRTMISSVSAGASINRVSSQTWKMKLPTRGAKVMRRTARTMAVSNAAANSPAPVQISHDGKGSRSIHVAMMIASRATAVPPASVAQPSQRGVSCCP